MFNNIKYLFILLITLSFFSCVSENTSIISPPVNDTKPVWPQVGYNGRHTGSRYGINTEIPPVQNGYIYWVDTISTGFVRDGSESSIDALGNIYFLSTNSPKGNIIKYRSDGTIIWTKDSIYLDAGCGIALSHDETKVYYSDYTKFTCIDSAGSILWSIPSANSPVMPAVGKDGTVFTVIDRKLSAVSMDGNIKWQLLNSDFNIAWLALDREDNIVSYMINPAGGYEIIKVSKNGEVVWEYPHVPALIGVCCYSSVVIDGYENIYFKSGDSLVSLTKDGKHRWNRYNLSKSYVPAINKNNEIITDSLGYYIVLDKDGNTLSKNLVSNILYIRAYIVIDDLDNVYFNYEDYTAGFNISVCSLDKYGNIRWQCVNPAPGWVLPGLTLSPLGMLFDTPKRPNVVFTIK